MNQQQKQFILAFLAYAAQRDLPVEKLCYLAGISMNALMAEETPVISPKQFNDLWLNACHLSNDPLFGLHFGESLQLAALGAVGEIIKSSATIGQGVEHAAALTPLITDLFDMEIKREAHTFTLHLLPDNERRIATPFAFEQMACFLMVFAVRELDGLILARIRPEHVAMPFPDHAGAELERVLRCRPTFSEQGYSISFDSKYWELPILTANYALQESLLQKINAIAAEERSDSSWQRKVYQYLLKNAYLGIVSLDEMAANFNVSPRSLQRKLKDERVTYQELADDVRKTLALHYLESGGYYIKEISYMLGYNELSAFSRAFKRWTGVAPGEWKGGV